MVVGHGHSICTFPWQKVKHYPKILINFVDMSFENVIGIMVWDKDTLKDVNDRLKDAPNRPMVYTTGSVDMIPRYNFFIDPDKFPPRIDVHAKMKIFSGARAIYLAQHMGFEHIYLVGFDFEPHKEKIKDYKVIEKEYDHYQISADNIMVGLNIQIDCFGLVKWIHRNIYQTNPNSRFKKFPYKLPPELEEV